MESFTVIFLSDGPVLSITRCIHTTRVHFLTRTLRTAELNNRCQKETQLSVRQILLANIPKRAVEEFTTES